jgi:hypothetical protein
MPHAPFSCNILIINTVFRGTPLKKVAPWVPLFVPLFRAPSEFLRYFCVIFAFTEDEGLGWFSAFGLTRTIVWAYANNRLRIRKR